MDIQTILLIADAFGIGLLALGAFGPYVYAFALSRLPQARQGQGPVPGKPVSSKQPSLTVIIPVHENAAPVGRKLAQLLNDAAPATTKSTGTDAHATEIPEMASPDVGIPDPEVIVACDGPVENLDCLAPYRDRIHLLHLPRRGKNAALNAAAARAQGEILLITDREAGFDGSVPERIREYFALPDVGGVCGAIAIRNDHRTGQQSHWQAENFIKKTESDKLGNLTAATGCLLAIKASLWPDLPHNVADDLYLALHLKARKKRFLFADDLVAVVPPRTRNLRTAVTRQSRITAQSFATLARFAFLLRPRFPSPGHFACMLLLHKVLRRLVLPLFFSLTLFALATIQLDTVQAVLALACTGGVLACTGIFVYCLCRVNTPHPLLGKIAWLYAVQLGICLGALRYLAGKSSSLWNSVQSAE